VRSQARLAACCSADITENRELDTKRLSDVVGISAKLNAPEE
jgi:hypothetical protein